MKKFLGFLLLFSFVLLQSKAQNSLTFCNGVDEDGNAKWAFTTITNDPKGYISCLLKMEEGKSMNTDSLSFKVYMKDTKGNLQFKNTVMAGVQPDWIWVYKEMFLFGIGDYMVEVYDRKNKMLCSGSLHLVDY